MKIDSHIKNQTLEVLTINNSLNPHTPHEIDRHPFRHGPNTLYCLTKKSKKKKARVSQSRRGKAG